MRLLRYLAFLVMLTPMAWANTSARGFCEAGAQTVKTSGIVSLTQVQASFPGCLVTVYNTGTVTLSTIYSDNNYPPTALANPFHATTVGQWQFFAANGLYDVVVSAPCTGVGVVACPTMPTTTFSTVQLYEPGVIAAAPAGLQTAINNACSASGNGVVIMLPTTYTQNTAITGLCSNLEIQGAGWGRTFITTTLNTTQLFDFTSLDTLYIHDFTVKPTGTLGSNGFLFKGTQWVDMQRVNVVSTAGTFTDAFVMDATSGTSHGSTIYNTFRSMLVTGASANLWHWNNTSSTNKTVNANTLWNVVNGPTVGNVGNCTNIDSASTSTIGENVWIGGENSGCNNGFYVNSAQARDLTRIGQTTESNVSNGVFIAASADSTNDIGSVIDSNGTNYTDNGVRTWNQSFVSGASATRSLDNLGNLKINGIGINGAAPVANGINYNGSGGVIQSSGTTNFTFSTTKNTIGSAMDLDSANATSFAIRSNALAMLVVNSSTNTITPGAADPAFGTTGAPWPVINGQHYNQPTQNNDFTGAITLNGASSGSHTFGTAYTGNTNCTVVPQFDVGSGVRFWVTSTTTTVTVHTSGNVTGSFTYMCSGAPN